jgi:AAA family ATP:ADP antiporter
MNAFRWRPGSGMMAATLASATLGAQFVAGKATRDALFLAHFEPSALPLMIAGAAVISVVLVMAGWTALRRIPPSTHVPATFAISALLLLVAGLLPGLSPGSVARVVYLLIAGVSPILGSGFWLLASERFDPRTAKQRFGEIGGAGTLGGLAGGLVAAQVATVGGVAAMLPLLAVLQAICAWQMRSLALSIPARRTPQSSEVSAQRPSALRVLADAPYLRSLAALVLLGTMSGILLDYVFKVQVKASFADGVALARFFSLYYAAISLITFAVQWFGSRALIEKLGLVAAASAPSVSLALGSAIAIFVPGLRTIVAAHGSELVCRGALLRTGYELFYTPLAPADKRTVKATIDVGVARVGDLLGAGIVQAVLSAGGAAPMVPLLALGIGGSLLALLVARPLTRGYVRTLEQRLLDGAMELDLSEVEDRTTRTAVLRSVRVADHAPSTMAAADLGFADIVALGSGDPGAIRAVLDKPAPLPASLVPHVIPLLAVDAIAPDAIHALRRVAEEHVGQLADALLDPNQPFAIRRRLPRVFSVCVSQRAADGLLLGLDDVRFEVRFQCGRAVAAIVDKNPRIRVDGEFVLAHVRREVAVSRGVWKGRQLLDGIGGAANEPSALEAMVGERASQSLAHVFTLLALVLPPEPLRVAFCALHTTDQALRGTALEYLDAVLPADIREQLWPFLECDPAPRPSTRRREDIVADLLRSNESIVLNLTR